ncbi:MAG TPA: hypothetical protein PK847_01850 [Candidatus Sumerlaeota bacterium]|nr:hypothetical protein [Candidatus Sumerlaeota bacterium]
MKPIALYLPFGPVHLRNLLILSRHMPEWDFVICHSTRTESLAACPAGNGFSWLNLDDIDSYLIAAGQRIKVAIFSKVFPDKEIFLLLAALIRHKLPAIAIEEVNQHAMTEGRINNYIVPIDHLFLASPYEADALTGLGVPAEVVEVTGWPFHSQLLDDGIDHRSETRARLGIQGDEEVITLALSLLSDGAGAVASTETQRVRHDLITTVEAVRLPGQRTVVKLHPREDFDAGVRSVKSCSPRVIVAPPDLSIHHVLEISAACINRGNSQVILEALLRSIPVLLVPLGLKTIFDGTNSKEVLSGSEDLRNALLRLRRGIRPDYSAVLANHSPIAPDRAIARVVHRIEEIACEPLTRHPDMLVGILLWAASLQYQDVTESLVPHLSQDSRSDLLQSVKALLRECATHHDIKTILNNVNIGLLSQAVLAIWLRQLSKYGANREDLALLSSIQDFPSDTNSYRYLQHYLLAAELLASGGYRDRAEVILEKVKEYPGLSLRWPDLWRSLCWQMGDYTPRNGYNWMRRKWGRGFRKIRMQRRVLNEDN